VSCLLTGTALAALLATTARAQDELDLLELTMEDPLAEEEALELYGFADFTFGVPLNKAESVWSGLFWPYPTFAVGNLNLYLRSTLSRHWNSLIEVRFLYLPHGGSAGTISPGELDVTKTSVRDYTEGFRELRWGGVEIERAWIEYSLGDLLRFRAGQWLTPYGIWNVDHGSPTIIAIQRPYVVGEELFPERQTGIQALGTVHVIQHRVEWHLTVSNGRGPFDAYRDLDGNKGVGGRVEVSHYTFGEISIAGSFYYGRYTRRDLEVLVQDGGMVSDWAIDKQYDELALGADLLWVWGGFHLQGEFVSNQLAFTDEGRQVDFGANLKADRHRWGTYGLVGYRFDFLGLMPFALVEYMNEVEGDTPPATHVAGGFNLRPSPRVTAKLQYWRVTFIDPQTPPFDEPLHNAAAQLAWAFEGTV